MNQSFQLNYWHMVGGPRFQPCCGRGPFPVSNLYLRSGLSASTPCVFNRCSLSFAGIISRKRYDLRPGRTRVTQKQLYRRCRALVEPWTWSVAKSFGKKAMGGHGPGGEDLCCFGVPLGTFGAPPPYCPLGAGSYLFSGSADQRWMVLPWRSRGQTRATRGVNDPPQGHWRVSCSCLCVKPVVAHRCFALPGSASHPSCAGA
jgi:hypothetical protein